MKRYAFIDVPNTEGSAKLLDFTIDPQKLYNYLMYDKWSCTQVFWYSGRIRTEKHEKRREKIESMGFVMRDKDTFFHKKIHEFDVRCPHCNKKSDHKIEVKGLPKANCDVELTVDCLELASPDVEFILFTGDGDFHYLIEKLIVKGVKIRIISTNKEDYKGNRRLSTRLKELLKIHENTPENMVSFVELDNLKKRLGKELEEKTEE